MRRRSHLVVAFVALVTVGWNVVTTQPGGSALAADPQAELQQTRAQLADARTAQQALSATLQRQRSELADLEHRSNQLGDALDLARAELAAVTAEYDHVSSLLVQVKEQVTEIELIEHAHPRLLPVVIDPAPIPAPQPRLARVRWAIVALAGLLGVLVGRLSKHDD